MIHLLNQCPDIGLWFCQERWADNFSASNCMLICVLMATIASKTHIVVVLFFFMCACVCIYRPSVKWTFSTLVYACAEENSSSSWFWIYTFKLFGLKCLILQVCNIGMNFTNQSHLYDQLTIFIEMFKISKFISTCLLEKTSLQAK